MKLYYSPNLNPRVAVAVARYLDSPVEYVPASPRAPGNTEAFRAINPNALVPVLVDGERRIWEADAIACHLSRVAESDFWRTGDDAPEMIMWMSWAANHFNAAGGALYFEKLIRPKYMGQPGVASVIEEAMRDFRTHAAVLEGELKVREWLVGDRVSYADFRVGTAMPFAKGAELPLDEFPNIARWAARLDEIDAWREPFVGLE